MVERKSAGGHGARCAWIVIVAAWLLLLAAVPPAVARDDDRTTAQSLWDKYPLEGRRDKAATATQAAAPRTMEAATSGSDGAEQAALLLSLALLGGGATGWLLSLRRPRAHMLSAAAPLAVPVRSIAPRLWAPSAVAPTSEPAPVPAAVDPPPQPPRPPGEPTPPEPDRAWAAEIEWHLVDGASQFRVIARAVDGAGEPIALGASALLEWPPAGARSVQALTDAVKALESALVAAGWTPLPSGSVWYAKRFTWQPGALPPVVPAAAGRVRHRDLYAAEYERQVDRTLRLRQTIAARVTPPDRDRAVGARSD